ncbi:MAG: IS3 family transposase [Actinobacteria bacterium]|nr:IS3 family transposase [Actinomycetota bacterium]
MPAARGFPLGLPCLGRRQPSGRAAEDARLLGLIGESHRRGRGTYGSPRVHAELRRRGVRVGRKRVERLMRSAGLSGLHLPRKTRTTIRVPGVRPARDLVERDFSAEAPNRVWAADIKQIPTGEGTPLPRLGARPLQPTRGRLVDAPRHAGRARRLPLAPAIRTRPQREQLPTGRRKQFHRRTSKGCLTSTCPPNRGRFTAVLVRAVGVG